MYDLHVHPEIDLEKMLSMAERLGWEGVCLVGKTMQDIENLKKDASLKKPNLDVSFGLNIEARNPEGVRKKARELRKNVELILVFGGDPEINRAACETPEVDVLAHPELGENNGLDHVMARKAKENGVAIEFNFRQLLVNYKKSRSECFSRMLENAKLVKKYRTPFVLTSGALSPWDLRGPPELASFGRLLGFSDPEIRKALEGGRIAENRKRLGSGWIMPGVEKA